MMIRRDPLMHFIVFRRYYAGIIEAVIVKSLFLYDIYPIPNSCIRVREHERRDDGDDSSTIPRLIRRCPTSSILDDDGGNRIERILYQ